MFNLVDGRVDIRFRNLVVVITVFFLIFANSCRKPTAPSGQGPTILWSRTYGGASNDEGKSVQQTFDGGYIITGWTQSFGHGSADVYLIKTDAYGNPRWMRTYGGSSADAGYSVQRTSDGGYIIAGSTSSFGAGESDVYIVKTDANGSILWSKTYGGSSGDAAYSVQQTSDGGYIIAGLTNSFGNGNNDVYLIKTDVNGGTIWTKTYGGSNSDVGWSVQQTSDKGYIIVGETKSFGASQIAVYLIKTDLDGNAIWTRTYGGEDGSTGRSIQQTSDEGYIIVGSKCSYVSWTNEDVYLIKTDKNGDTLWTKTYGGDNSDGGYSVQQTADKGFIIAGWTESSGAGGIDVYLIKTDADGDTLWTKTCGGADWDFGFSVQLTSDCGYIVVGKTVSFGAGSFDVYVIKIR